MSTTIAVILILVASLLSFGVLCWYVLSKMGAVKSTDDTGRDI